MEASLLRALEDVQLRSKVEVCVRDMVADVELAHTMEEKLRVNQKLCQLELRLVERDWALEEFQAIQHERETVQRTVADKLVGELWCLSRQLGELKQIKQEHEKLLVQYDEVVAKVYQMEDDLLVAAESRERARSSETKQEIQKQPSEDKQGEIMESNEFDGHCAVGPMGTYTDGVALATGKGQGIHSTDTEQPTSHVPPAKKEIRKGSGAVASVSLEQACEQESPKLETLDTKILMQIFAFLDALDILNTAQVNISMYSRVDSLFGLGAAVDTTADGDNSTIASAETIPAQQPTTSSVDSFASKGQQQQYHSSGLSAAGNSAHRRADSTPALSTTSAAEGFRGLFSSMLQPSRSTKPTSTPPRVNSRNAVSESQPMNAAMASSMASKLTDAELNAIILMTERLRQKELLADKLLQERQDLMAKLDGTEAVKQFLIAKVRDMEETLAAVEENETKVAQQIASDQEVIAFLDGRVQDLEREKAAGEKEHQKLRDELARTQQQAEQKAVVMGDMLQFEREKWSESEREWKATKKVLIKEVKSCRAQIVALRAERDGYREQNDMLLKAFVPGTAAVISQNAR